MTLITQNNLGKSLKEREEYISRITSTTPDGKNHDHIVSYKGKDVLCPVYEIDIEFVIYRLSNVRTKSGQRTYIHENNLDDNFFRRDEECRDALKAQHDILFNISNSGDEFKNHYKNFMSGQKFLKGEPILINSRGVMINGNTRLSAIKEILSDPNINKDYSYLKTVWAAVLPTNISKLQEREIEISLQIEPDWKKDYSWTSMALDVRDRFIEEGTLNNVIEDYGHRKNNNNHPENLLKQIDIADIYLNEIGKSSMYNIVDKMQFAFKEWDLFRNDYEGDANEQTLIDRSLTAIVSSPKKGNLYKEIGKIRKNWEGDRVLRNTELTRKSESSPSYTSNTIDESPKDEKNPFAPRQANANQEKRTNEIVNTNNLSNEDIADTIRTIRTLQDKQEENTAKQNILKETADSVCTNLNSILEMQLDFSSQIDISKAKDGFNQIIKIANQIIQSIDKENNDD